MVLREKSHADPLDYNTMQVLVSPNVYPKGERLLSPRSPTDGIKLSILTGTLSHLCLLRIPTRIAMAFAAERKTAVVLIGGRGSRPNWLSKDVVHARRLQELLGAEQLIELHPNDGMFGAVRGGGGGTSMFLPSRVQCKCISTHPPPAPSH